MLGLGLSLSHCFFMCGGILLLFKERNFAELLIYHLFRILAYVLIGVLAYLLGFFISSLNFQIFLYFFLGFFCIILGIALLSRGALLAFIENQYLYRYLMRLLQRAKNLKARALIFGFLNGFFPCGLVYFFIAKSIMASNLAEAALNMLAFGLSTLPALLAGGVFLKYLKSLQYLCFSLIILYGIYLCYLALKLSQP